VPALLSWWTQDVTALSRLAGTGDVAAAGSDLLARWREPHRRYHSTRHLAEMFWALADLTDAGELSDREAGLARVAAWLHDAAYDPAAPPGVNETASAALAEQLLGQLQLDEASIRTVVELVRMTAEHAVSRDSRLDRAFHDADLWILSAPAERFDEYCRQVREEYASVPDERYAAARSAILRGLDGPGGIYLTTYGRNHWDGSARENLARELARLARLLPEGQVNDLVAKPVVRRAKAQQRRRHDEP
jgi:predicted metal-dependent HD superfamily phosphohydrolase